MFEVFPLDRGPLVNITATKETTFRSSVVRLRYRIPLEDLESKKKTLSALDHVCSFINIVDFPVKLRCQIQRPRAYVALVNR